jgi:hypothetical protein
VKARPGAEFLVHAEVPVVGQQLRDIALRIVQIASAPAMQAFTQAGVACGSIPGVSPRSSPSSMRSTQKVHLVATASRASSRRWTSFSVGLPYANCALSVL